MPPKRSTKSKPLPVATEPEVESEFTVEEEILWCIKKLEKALLSENINAKTLTSTVLALKTLKSSKAPFIKKRQVMRLNCGDYRKAMIEDLKKSATESKKISLQPVIDTKNGSVVNTSKSKDCSQNSEESLQNSPFAFNFPTPDEEDLRINLEELKITPTESVSQ